MDGSRPGEAGVLAWCNTIRFNMAKDPGRQIFQDQIQTQGFDFLDSYLESFFEGPSNEPVIELLKTPGRKKNAPTRTRSATAAAAAKSRVIASLSFEDGDTKENHGPVNEFQKALLRAKEKAEGEDARNATSSQQPTVAGPIKRSTSFAKLKNQKIVTIADSPATQAPNADERRMDLDEEPKPIPALIFHPGPPSMERTGRDYQETPQDGQESIKELSMIAEDDEPAERSRASLNAAPPQTAMPAAPQVPSEFSRAQGAFHDASHEAPPSAMETDEADDGPVHVPAAPEPQSEEPIPGDLTSASANTFHSIPLDSPQATEREPPSVRADEYHTAPLPKVSLPPVPVDAEAHSHTAPLPASSSRHEEYTMPLREEPSVPVPGLSRKGSVPQFAGLPAPSPLRKSLRVAGDPTTANSGGTTAAPPGGKRTSWLSKARETKALETTAKRTSTLGQGLGLGVFSNKRKSGEMLESARDAFAGQATSLKSLDEEQRIVKVPKLASSPADVAFDSKGKQKAASPDTAQETAQHVATPIEVATAATSNAVQQADSDVLGLFKKTAAGFGARVGKSMGKSLGGNAAAALAEARAKAEARVAERHKLEMGLSADSEDVSMTSEDKPSSSGPAAAPVTESKESERRLSVSDLVPTSAKGNAASPATQPSAPLEADTSTSTTPPNSPPPVSRNTSFVLPSGPVFSKPTAPAGPRVPTVASSVAPVRTDAAAAPSAGRDFSSFKLPTNPFSIPAAMTLGMGSKFVPLSAQSSKNSIFSDVVFDHNNMSPQPAWMPSTQDTSYSAGGSQSQGADAKAADNDDLDEDDSWGVDEKFAAHQTWTPFGFSTDQGTNGEQVLKDDTMTWSTLPSRSTSQRGGDTGSIQPTTQSFFSTLPQSKEEEEEEEVAEDAGAQEDFAARLAAAAQQPSDADEGANGEADMAMEIDEDVEERDELGEAVLAGKPTVTLVQQTKTDMPTEFRSESQQSMASTASSSQQSQLGFFGQASKLVSSVLGGGKKNKPEVKSLQLAAAAAKKQQEELEKKAARLKEMENRRQLALQRKAEEEKTRALEEERKIKEEAERRKREREEHTDKRPLRSTTAIPKKAEEDTTNKRKVGAETSQKPPSKDKKATAAPRAVKPPTGPAASTSSKPSALPKSAMKQPSSSTVPVTPGAAKAAPKTVKHVPSSSNLKSAAAKGKTPAREASEPPAGKSTKPAAPGPIQGGPPAEPPRVASESIELPEINSEYSDSDDEDRPKRELPEWAQSPDIAAALQQQSTINPDDIFGRIGPLRMEEIFRTRQSRFRARTSSANWTGTDELTAEEEREYARRMGFR
ncbi:hypothetical protein OH77DRAFT_1444400 [Trametes cingulata]|nr:hypothetical protein OH77DRAFT_1444400 [Trametes cingulata]